MKTFVSLAFTAFVLIGCQSTDSFRPLPTQPLTPQNVRTQTDDFKTVPELIAEGVKAIRTARFNKLDRNNDGRLIPGEVKPLDLRLPGLPSDFASYDRNQDAEIVLGEFLRPDVLQFFEQFYDSIIEDNFFLSDLNRDRVLTDDERREINQKLRAWPELNGGDANGDNMLDYREYLQAYLLAEARKN